MNCALRVGAGALTLAALLAGPVRAAEVDKRLPSDTTLVMSVNVQQLLGSPLFKKHAEEKVKEAMKSDEETQKVLKELGLNPLTDFSRVTFALTSSGGPEKPLIIVRGKFDPAKIEAKGTEFAKAHADKLTVGKEGGVTVFEIKGGQGPNQTLFAALLDDSTLAAGSSKSVLADAIAQHKGEKKATPSKDLTELIGAADDKQSLWLAILPGFFEKLPVPDPNFKKSVEQLSALTGQVSVNNDLKVEIGLVSKNDDAAKGLATQVEQGLEQAKSVLPILLGAQEELKPVIELVNSMKSSSAGKTVTIKGGLTEKYIDEQLEKAGAAGPKKSKPPEKP